ncbi:MAG: hypothetical protein ACYDC1_10015 [Limisphaerales bacterium]
MQGDLRLAAGRGGQIAASGLDPFRGALGQAQAANPVSTYDQPQAIPAARDRRLGDGAALIPFFAPHHQANRAVHDFAPELHHVAVVVVPRDIHLLVLPGGLILDLHRDLDLVPGRVGGRSHEHVPRVVRAAPQVARKDAKLEGAVAGPPGHGRFPHP